MMKRCELEFVTTLNKTFNINTPQVMSYFPNWGYLLGQVNEIVNQISGNSSSNASNKATSNMGFNTPNAAPVSGNPAFGGPVAASTNSYGNYSNLTSGYFAGNTQTNSNNLQSNSVGGYGSGSYFDSKNGFNGNVSNNAKPNAGGSAQWR